jgi:hypothetical protein
MGLGLGAYPIPPFRSMLLSPHSFRVKVSYCFNSVRPVIGKGEGVRLPLNPMGNTGFEPVTSSMSRMRSNQLS